MRPELQGAATALAIVAGAVAIAWLIVWLVVK